MWKVISQEQIGQLAREHSVITIVVARSMNSEFIRWLYDSWKEIHRIAGAQWHIVIPSCSGEWVYSRDAVPQDFNTELSLEIANSYGVSRSEFPCLIMEDFCEDAIPIRISIPDGDRARAKFVDDFAELARSVRDDEFEHADWRARRSINSSIANSLSQKKLASLGVKLLPKAIGALARFGIQHS